MVLPSPHTHPFFPGGHGCSGSDFLGLAPPAIIRARLHLRSSLCLRGDADTDKDDAAAASFPSASRLGAGAEQSEPGAGGVSLLRGEFIKDSSNMDELRFSTLLEAIFFNTENGGIAARCEGMLVCAALINATGVEAAKGSTADASPSVVCEAQIKSPHREDKRH